jgi:hypothetical protein
VRGELKLNDNALVALALLTAESDPGNKELMIRLIMHLLAEQDADAGARSYKGVGVI